MLWRSERNFSPGGFGLEILADSLHDLSALGAILQKPLGAALLDLLGHGRQSRQGLDPNARLLTANRPRLGILWVRVVPDLLFHFDELLEADIARRQLHRPRRPVHHGGLDAVANVLADDLAHEPRPRGVDREGPSGVELPRAGLEPVTQRVHVEDVREGSLVLGIGELAPRS